ncbi:hypothetical protein PV10_05945 [Exophiala mesophila]|uniref:Uncharacterized protein n=1 Tax=Exophiala mesophila TaxID=212818 RepID=A0A0D1Z9L4_EXOME|nr:uncharacterized protein PV10_05945 [Exophiala mesophila]KIV91402.1 hypothetical protein PV10_05945 [Exophiala mesophila]
MFFPRILLFLFALLLLATGTIAWPDFRAVRPGDGGPVLTAGLLTAVFTGALWGPYRVSYEPPPLPESVSFGLPIDNSTAAISNSSSYVTPEIITLTDLEIAVNDNRRTLERVDLAVCSLSSKPQPTLTDNASVLDTCTATYYIEKAPESTIVLSKWLIITHMLNIGLLAASPAIQRVLMTLYLGAISTAHQLYAVWSDFFPLAIRVVEFLYTPSGQRALAVLALLLLATAIDAFVRWEWTRRVAKSAKDTAIIMWWYFVGQAIHHPELMIEATLDKYRTRKVQAVTAYLEQQTAERKLAARRSEIEMTDIKAMAADQLRKEYDYLIPELLRNIDLLNKARVAAELAEHRAQQLAREADYEQSQVALARAQAERHAQEKAAAQSRLETARRELEAKDAYRTMELEHARHQATLAQIEAERLANDEAAAASRLEAARQDQDADEVRRSIETEQERSLALLAQTRSLRLGFEEAAAKSRLEIARLEIEAAQLQKQAADIQRSTAATSAAVSTTKVEVQKEAIASASRVASSSPQQLFDASFPFGFDRIMVSSDNLHCGLYAVIASLTSQHPTLDVYPSVKDLLDCSKGPEYKKTCEEFALTNDDNFTIDQIGLMVYLFYKDNTNYKYNVQVGGKPKDAAPFLVPTPDSHKDDCVVVWIYNDANGQIVESSDGDFTIYSHYEGLRSKAPPALTEKSDEEAEEEEYAKLLALFDDTPVSTSSTSGDVNLAATDNEAEKAADVHFKEDSEVDSTAAGPGTTTSGTDVPTEQPSPDAHFKEGQEIILQAPLPEEVPQSLTVAEASTEAHDPLPLKSESKMQSAQQKSAGSDSIVETKEEEEEAVVSEPVAETDARTQTTQSNPWAGNLNEDMSTWFRPESDTETKPAPPPKKSTFVAIPSALDNNSFPALSTSFSFSLNPAPQEPVVAAPKESVVAAPEKPVVETQPPVQETSIALTGAAAELTPEARKALMEAITWHLNKGQKLDMAQANEGSKLSEPQAEKEASGLPLEIAPQKEVADEARQVGGVIRGTSRQNETVSDRRGSILKSSIRRSLSPKKSSRVTFREPLEDVAKEEPETSNQAPVPEPSPETAPLQSAAADVVPGDAGAPLKGQQLSSFNLPFRGQTTSDGTWQRPVQPVQAANAHQPQQAQGPREPTRRPHDTVGAQNLNTQDPRMAFRDPARDANESNSDDEGSESPFSKLNDTEPSRVVNTSSMDITGEPSCAEVQRSLSPELERLTQALNLEDPSIHSDVGMGDAAGGFDVQDSYFQNLLNQDIDFGGSIQDTDMLDLPYNEETMAQLGFDFPESSDPMASLGPGDLSLLVPATNGFVFQQNDQASIPGIGSETFNTAQENFASGYGLRGNTPPISYVQPWQLHYQGLYTAAGTMDFGTSTFIPQDLTLGSMATNEVQVVHPEASMQDILVGDNATGTMGFGTSIVVPQDLSLGSMATTGVQIDQLEAINQDTLISNNPLAIEVPVAEVPDTEVYSPIDDNAVYQEFMANFSPLQSPVLPSVQPEAVVIANFSPLQSPVLPSVQSETVVPSIEDESDQSSLDLDGDKHNPPGWKPQSVADDPDASDGAQDAELDRIMGRVSEPNDNSAINEPTTSSKPTEGKGKDQAAKSGSNDGSNSNKPTRKPKAPKLTEEDIMDHAWNLFRDLRAPEQDQVSNSGNVSRDSSIDRLLRSDSESSDGSFDPTPPGGYDSNEDNDNDSLNSTDSEAAERAAIERASQQLKLFDAAGVTHQDSDSDDDGRASQGSIERMLLQEYDHSTTSSEECDNPESGDSDDNIHTRRRRDNNTVKSGDFSVAAGCPPTEDAEEDPWGDS